MGLLGRSADEEISRLEGDRDRYDAQLARLEKAGLQQTDAARTAASRMRACEEELDELRRDG